VQVNATFPLYPFSAVAVPFHVTSWFTTVTLGVATTPTAKFAAGPVTVSAKVWLLAAGAPAVIAETVTVVGPPTGVAAAAVTVNVTVTGEEAVGLTELDGENTQAAPVGSPTGQLSAIVPEKFPSAAT
jgi:hypothetical protein